MTEEIQQAIDQALDDNLRADELAEMIDALRDRRRSLTHDLDACVEPAARKDTEARLRDIDKRIEMLRQEHAISAFVETTVRISATRPRQFGIDEDGEE